MSDEERMAIKMTKLWFNVYIIHISPRKILNKNKKIPIYCNLLTSK